jgi:hypothetical protein
MKLLSFIVILLFASNTIAQITTIPDSNFEQRLITLGYDTGTVNGFVPTAYIDTITDLGNIGAGIIADLTGIEDFTALEYINCSDNLLTSLDFSQNLVLDSIYCSVNLLTSINVTQNTALKFLRFDDNAMSSIDLSQNPNLKTLMFPDNQITSIDVTQNTALEFIYCPNNLITSIDVSQNLALSNFNIRNNQLQFLDVTQNPSLFYLDCRSNQLTCLNVKNGNNTILQIVTLNNPNLGCIDVDNPSWSTTFWTNIDPVCTFSTNCGNSCSPVGIDEYAITAFTISPNPVNDYLAIKTTNNNAHFFTIRNVLGKTIKNLSFTKNESIDVSELSSGIYFLQIGNSIQKFIKK